MPSVLFATTKRVFPLSIPIPTTLDDLLVGIGKAVAAQKLIDQNKGFGELAALQGQSDQDYVKLGKEWCRSYNAELNALCAVVRRALKTKAKGGSVHSTLGCALFTDSEGIWQSLNCMKPSYFVEVFTAGVTQTGDKLQRFLELILKLGT